MRALRFLRGEPTASDAGHRPTLRVRTRTIITFLGRSRKVGRKTILLFRCHEDEARCL